MKREQLEQMLAKASKSVQKLNEHLARVCPYPHEQQPDSPQWTIREDAILRAAYESSRDSGIPLQIKSLSDSLGRSSNGIFCRAGELGIAFPRGRFPRRKPKPRHIRPAMNKQELSDFKSKKAIEWHANHVHPMLGRPVPDEVRKKISDANRGKTVPPERILKSLQTRALKGNLVFNRKAGSWKSGWRTVGGQRIYARSRWEANYARYLEFQKEHGLIECWKHEPKTFWFLNIKRGCRTYLPDFEVKTKSGIEYHEVKGWMDARSKTKLRRMAKYFPEVILIVKDSAWFRKNRLKLRSIVPGWEDGRT